MNTLEKLKWLVQAGITESIGETPVNRLHASAPQTLGESDAAVAKADTLLPARNRQAGPNSAPKAPVGTGNSALAQAVQLAESAATLADLYQARQAFQGCPLKKTAAHTLSGRGTLPARVLCVGDVPDGTDDKQNRVFAGESGVLLDKMLAALGLALDKDTYATILIPWRPPGNRKPTELEIALSLPFLKREIQLIQPTYLLLFGALPTRALLGIDSLPKARLKWHDYQGIPTLATFSPTAILKAPEHRRPTWEDLKRLKEQLESAAP